MSHDHDGPFHWRSLEQLARSPKADELLHREFQDGADEMPVDDVSRRNFLGLLGASIALAGMSGCRKPVTAILPFAKRPEDLVLGVPRYYATAHVASGYGVGTLVKSSDGRPTKVEGNPLHPSSLGRSTQFMQAEVLNLYDPARSKHPRRGREPATWAGFEQFCKQHFAGLTAKVGEGLALLCEPTSSPSMLAMLAAFGRQFPSSKAYYWTPLHRDQELAGNRAAFGSELEAHYQFDRAEVVVAFDSDFLQDQPNSVRYARDWATTRKIRRPEQKLSRLYVVEAGYSLTGAAADHRFRVGAAQVTDALLALAAELDVFGDSPLGKAVAAHKNHGLQQGGKNWVAAVAKDLRAAEGRCLVVAGPRQPPLAHALAHAIHEKLGSFGKTVALKKTAEGMGQACTASLRALAAAIDAGQVKTLVILGGNPVYTAPADLDLAARLQKVATTIHLGLHDDETGQVCSWHLNQAHDLEAWGDIRSFDGTPTIVQPLVAPLYAGARAPAELLALLIDPEQKQGTIRHTSYAIVQQYWQGLWKEQFDNLWARSVREGLVQDARFGIPQAQGRVLADKVAELVAARTRPQAPSSHALEVCFLADYRMQAGRYSNNAWMAELPDPLTKLTWDNAALLSRRTAAALGLGNGDVARLTLGDRSLEIPVWILPGHADDCVTLPLGYGRRLSAGHKVAMAEGCGGFDTFRLRTSDAQWLASGARLTPAGRHYQLVCTQEHGSMENRPLAREGTLARFRQQPDFAPEMSPLAITARVHNERTAAGGAHAGHEHAAQEKKTEGSYLRSLDPESDYSQGYQWGMVIDLNSCIGCNACVVACVAENNIPVVGKKQVARNREMHWLRIDRYFSGPAQRDGVAIDAEPQVVTQPVPCQQCENAKCEEVCPVAATTHSPEGLNDMAYNRCVGTRYCSNNCPFKVRRFNWFNFTGAYTETEKMVHNPDVTVRSRGVMEKCTYCVQRIQGAKIRARNDGRRPLRDGEFTTACAQTCPTEAITFGNINDAGSEVSKLRATSLNYAMLSELNVKPRTTYLARIRNPNPELV
jgi:molybdopterin-containing oxidoreductase family iron-sulfur binding subunit